MSGYETDREHMSASALRQLMTCPLQYRLQRIDGVQPSHRSPALVLGGLFHGVLSSALLLVKEGKDVARDQLVQWFEDGWAAHMKVATPPIRWSKKATEESERVLGRALVEAWHEQALPLFQKAESIVAVEMPFRVPVINTDGEVLEQPIDGFVDAVIRTVEGRMVVVDHKSAAQQFGDAAIEMDLQPTVYRHALRFLGIDDDAVFQYHVLSKTKSPKLTVVEVPRGDDDLDRLCWVCSLAERLIASGVFLPTSPGWLCDSCEYSHACRRAHAEIVGPADEPVPVPVPQSAAAAPPAAEPVLAE